MNKNQTSLLIAPGAVVTYKSQYFILWNINSSKKAELIDANGKKFSGTPNIDKLTWVKTLPTVFYINANYIVDRKNRIFSLRTGNQVYNQSGHQNKTILNLLINSNIHLINYDYSLKRIREDEYIAALLDEIVEKRKTITVKVLDETYERDLDETVSYLDTLNSSPQDDHSYFHNEQQKEIDREITDDEFRELYPTGNEDARYY